METEKNLRGRHSLFEQTTIHDTCKHLPFIVHLGTVCVTSRVLMAWLDMFMFPYKDVERGCIPTEQGVVQLKTQRQIMKLYACVRESDTHTEGEGR